MDVSSISACATCLLSGGCEVPAENSWMTTSDKQAASDLTLDARLDIKKEEYWISALKGLNLWRFGKESIVFHLPTK